MRVVAYYVTHSVWVGWLSSWGGVGLFTVVFGGLGLRLGWGCGYNVSVRLRDKESSQAGIA